MTATLSRADELRNDLNNLSFTIKHLFGVLSELEWDGASNSAEYKRIQKNIDVLKKNKTRLENELEKVESEEFENYGHLRFC